MFDPEAELLRLPPGASLAEVKRAFRKAALAHHPDQNPHPDAARHFRRLSEAYRILEARARLREPAPRPRLPPLGERMQFVAADLRALVRRWPAERWSQVVDGLPSAVWAASILEVLGRAWPGESEPQAVVPSPEGIARALDAWTLRTQSHPFPSRPSRTEIREATAALEAAESRLRALERPGRKKNP